MSYWLARFRELTGFAEVDDASLREAARPPAGAISSHAGDISTLDLPEHRNGFHYPAASPAIEAPAVTPEPALVVFCDFETRNIGGCDLTKAGAWRYAADPATEILCFGYRTGGVDHSWAPTSPSRDPLEALAADPDAVFACFGGFEAAVWARDHGRAARLRADRDPTMDRPARGVLLPRLASIAR